MNKDMIQNIFIGVLLGGVILLAGGVYYLAMQVQTATQGIERIEQSVTESMQKADAAMMKADESMLKADEAMMKAEEGAMMEQANAYRNENYGLSFNFDSKKYTVTESDVRGGATGEEGRLIRLQDTQNECVSVDIFVSPASLTEELNGLELGIDGDTTNTTVAGVSAMKRSGSVADHVPPCGTEKTSIVFEYSGNVFVISTPQAGVTLLDDLLSSLTF